MVDTQRSGQLIEGLNVIETTQTDNLLRWDGEMVYVEHDVYHNGQIVHRRYKRRVTPDIARALMRVVKDSV